MTDIGNSAFPILGLSPLFVLLLVFVVVPLVFSVCVAFTNFSAPAHIPPNKTVDWIGMENFKQLLTGKTNWSLGFARVALWMSYGRSVQLLPAISEISWLLSN